MSLSSTKAIFKFGPKVGGGIPEASCIPRSFIPRRSAPVTNFRSASYHSSSYAKAHHTMSLSPTAQQFSKEDKLQANETFVKAFDKYSKVASLETLNKVKEALIAKAHTAEVLESKEKVLDAIKAQIPDGADVYNTASATLTELGFVDFMIANKQWINVHGNAAVESAGDHAKLLKLLRKGCSASYVVSTADAVTEAGEFVVGDGSGTRVAAVHGAGEKVIYVIGANKIVSDLDAAHDRLNNYTYNLESARVRKVYGWPTAVLSNVITIHQGFVNPGRFHFILVNEPLGF